LSFRLGIILAAALLTASCGFRPLYAPSGTGSASEQLFAFDVFRKIEIGLIEDREGQFFRNKMIELLHPSGRARVVEYDLNTKLNESKANLAVRQSSDATRANLTMTTVYTLISRTDGTIVARGTVKSTSGYNIFNSEFQTLSAEKSARERALIDLAQQLRLRLATEFIRGDAESQSPQK